jgi:hypothetical protein
MFLKALSGGAVLACGVLAVAGLHQPPNGCPAARLLGLACASAPAEEPKEDRSALSGTWGKKDGELKIEFVDKNVLKIVPHGDSTVIAIVCDYTVEKGGLVKVKVTGLEGKEEVKQKVRQHVPVGFRFSFKWTMKGDAAKLEELMGDDVEPLKSRLEGDFEKK